MNLNRVASLPAQTVVVVNGSTDVVGMLENVLDAGRYDMVFVDAGDGAYSQIKSVHPHLVILCTRIEALDGFQLLTMLKLDADTRDIPVLTYTTEYEGQDLEADVAAQDDDDQPFLPSPVAMRMN
jgi:two-component system phosphate regulon response regulator PhoB